MNCNLKTNYPNIWGAGALFAFSGLDGVNSFTNSLCGMLCGDKIGIGFENMAVELVAVVKDVHDIKHEIVASDIISSKINGEKQLDIIFARENTIIGRVPKGNMDIHLVTYAEKTIEGKTEKVIWNDMVYVLKKRMLDEEIYFSFSGATSEECAIKQAEEGFAVDLQALREKKMKFYDDVPVNENMPYEQQKLMKKCYSVAKTQVYTKEGVFDCRWTTPDRLPHKALWLWDSVFHSFGNVFMSEELAFESLWAVLCTQKEDGLIPHMSCPDHSSDITQPPVLAWGFYQLYQKRKNLEDIQKSFPKLKAYLNWNIQNRRIGKSWLFGWKVNENNPNCRCDECGMDNSPRFDDVTLMGCVDFSCFMANEARFMARLAKIIGEDAAYWEEMYAAIRNDINARLWDEKNNFYYDRIVSTDRFKRVKAVSSFAPLFTGVCDDEKAKKLVEVLFDPDIFLSEAGISSIAHDEPTYGTDMWRGPVWINYNYMIMCGLYEYGYSKEAEELRKRTLDIMARWYYADGVVYEYYDNQDRVSPQKLNRKGSPINPYHIGIRMQSIRDYGWSATLCIALGMWNQLDVERLVSFKQ